LVNLSKKYISPWQVIKINNAYDKEHA